MSQPGILFLIPTVIADGTHDAVTTAGVKNSLKQIHHFLAEDVRTARRYLSTLKIYESIEALDFKVLNKDTVEKELAEMFIPVLEGKNLGVLSESGCPGIADPGALAVQYAHRNGIRVVPLVGPSSILMALMASGLNGQQFAFHGYLPIDPHEASQVIKKLEKESREKNQTQIFIETPYRNNQATHNFVKVLHPETLLCIALDITGPGESIQTLPVKQWKSKAVQWPKTPAVFLFLSQ
jgi:16S rRNA (cytidine1402-2'-O)-methyltransferase